MLRLTSAAALGALAFAAPASARQADPAAPDSSAQDSTGRFVLDPIQVTVTRSPESLSDIPFAVSVVSAPRELKGRTTIGPDELLERIPGVFVYNRYNPSLDQRVSIRGFGARSAFGVRGVKVLLDGVPQTLPDGQGQLTNIELSTIGSVEVLRGSASTLYGNATGGVISLQTIAPDATRITPAAMLVGGAYGMSKWRVGASLPLGHGTLAIAGSRTRSDGYREHSDADVRQLGVRLEQEIASGTTMLLTAHLADDPVLQNPGSLTATELDSMPAQANPRNLASGAGKAVSQNQVALTFVKGFSSGATAEATIFGLGRDLDNPLSFAYIAIDRVAFGLRGSATAPLSRSGLRPRLTVGLDLQAQRDDRINETPDRSEVTVDQRESVTELGPFAQLAMDLGRRTTVTVGTRFDRVEFDLDDRLLTNGDNSGERVMSRWSGMVGVVFEIIPQLQALFNVSTSFETPTTTELVNQPDGSSGLNPDLDSQTATNFEIGFRGGIDGTLDYSLAVYNTNVRDELIPFEVPSGDGRRFFRNAGSARHRGVELDFDWRPLRVLQFIGAYTFANYEFVEFNTEQGDFSGNGIPGIPDHAVYWSLRLGGAEGPWFATDQQYTSSYFTDDANTTLNSSWYVAGVRAGWVQRLGGWKIAPFAGVLNLFNEGYVGSVVVNAGFGRYFEPAPPRNGYLGIEFGPI